MDYISKMSSCISWIKEWFNNESNNAKGIVVEINDAMPNAVVAAMCAAAIGTDKVYGVILRYGDEDPVGVAIDVCERLKIDYRVIDFRQAYKYMGDAIKYFNSEIFPYTLDAQKEMADRVKYGLVNAVARSMEYKVAGAITFTDYYFGNFTNWGNDACDIEPIANFTHNDIANLKRIIPILSSMSLSSTEEEVYYEKLDNFINGDTKNLTQEEIERFAKFKKNGEYKLTRPSVFTPNISD